MTSARLLSAAWALLLSGIVCFAQISPLHVPTLGPLLQSTNLVGLGDIVTTGAQTLYWGFRAFSIATRGNKAVNACNSTGGVDVECLDFSTSVSTGHLVLTNFMAGSCASLGTNCTVKTLYDQNSGATSCGTSCDMTQATVAKRPVLVPSCTGRSHACMTCTAASSQELISVSNIPNVAQPFSASEFAKRPAAVTGILWGEDTNSTGSEEFFGGSANQFSIYSGTTVTASQTDGSFHALQTIHSGASSSITVDGSTTSGLNAGTGNFSGTLKARLCNSTFGPLLTGSIAEIAVFGSNVTFSGGQITNLNTNQQAYW